MKYTILKCPTEMQIGVILITATIIMSSFVVYFGNEGFQKSQDEYKTFVKDMSCDTLEFQAIHHEYESKRKIALHEHGERC